MVGVLVLALCGNSGHRHTVIQTQVVHVAGEGIVPNLCHLGKVNIFQAAGVVEAHIADGGIFAQGNGFQAGSTGKGVILNNRIFTDGQGLKGCGQLVVEALAAIHHRGFFFLVLSFNLVIKVHIGLLDNTRGQTLVFSNFIALNLEAMVLIHTEGVVTNGNIVPNSHTLQAQALREGTLRNRHTVRDKYGLNLTEGEGVLAQLGVNSQSRGFRNGSFKEGVFPNLCQGT